MTERMPKCMTRWLTGWLTRRTTKWTGKDATAFVTPPGHLRDRRRPALLVSTLLVSLIGLAGCDLAGGLATEALIQRGPALEPRDGYVVKVMVIATLFIRLFYKRFYGRATDIF